MKGGTEGYAAARESHAQEIAAAQGEMGEDEFGEEDCITQSEDQGGKRLKESLCR